MTQDEQNLNLLAIFHYIVGGLLALFSCIPLIHLGLGVFFIIFGSSFDEAPPEVLGWLFIFVASIVIIAGWALAVLIIVSGRKLYKRSAYTFCLVVAGVMCIFTPFGTVLGVFTIITLMKEPVKALFKVQR